MGLLKLAMIGGAAYYVGKKVNEPHYGPDGQQVPHGGCWNRKQKQQQQQQQQQQYDYQQGQGMTRDMPYPTNGYERNEKAPLPAQQTEYPAGYGYEHGYGQGNGWGYGYQPTQPQDSKPQLQSRRSREMVKFDSGMNNTNGDADVLPAYGDRNTQRQGLGPRSLSPHERMYPGQSQPRQASPVQNVFMDPKEKETERSTFEKLMWKN